MSYSLDTVILDTKSNGKPKSAIVLCHGYAGNGKNIALLANYWRDFLPDTIFLCPNAPDSSTTKKGSFQWFDPNEKNREKTLSNAIKSEAKLNKFIDEVIEKNSLSDDKLIIGGFSQGCMITLQAGIKRKNKIKSIIGYSGKIIDMDYLDRNINSKPNIYLFHGDKDEIVLPEFLNESKKFLQERNFNIKTKMFKECDHRIPREGVNLGLDFIKNFF